MNPDDVVVQDVQPHYYYAKSFEDVCEQLDEYGRLIGRPFNCHYDFVNNKIITDRCLEFTN